MQSILIGMKFFGAGIGRAEDLLQFFLGHNYDAAIERHCLKPRNGSPTCLNLLDSAPPP